MERDFFGKDSRAVVKDENSTGGTRQDSACFGGSPVQWPFSNNIASMQQFMSFKAMQEEKPQKFSFDHLSSSGFQPINTTHAFESSYQASNIQPQPQRCFGVDRNRTHQFSMPAYQNQSNDSLGTSSQRMVSHHSIPVATSSPFYNVHGSSNSLNLPGSPLKQQYGGITAHNAPSVSCGVGAFAPRNATKPSTSTSQLTIFYAGTVHVYDDVPLDKAQAILFWASKGSNALNSKEEAPVQATLPMVPSAHCFATNHTYSQTQSQNPSHLSYSQTQPQNPSHLSTSKSITSQGGANSRSGSSTTDEMAGAKCVGPSPTPMSQQEPSKAVTTPTPIVPGAVPQARKASLTRFLEKRKERVLNVAPYKKSPDNSAVFEGAKVSRPSSDMSRSSNREESGSSVQPKNSNNIRDFPSTKLEM